MKFKLSNENLVSSVNLFRRMPLTGYLSIARTHFVNEVLLDKVNEVGEAEKMLLEQYGARNEDGELIPTGYNAYQIVPELKNEYAQEKMKIFREVAEIDKSTYTGHMKDIKEILRDATVEISGAEADAYFELCNELNVEFERRGSEHE